MINRRNEIINELTKAVFTSDNDRQNILRIVLEEYDVEMSEKIGKTWLYNLIADICDTSPKSAYNKINGITDWQLSELTAIKNYFGTISYDSIINYINELKEIIEND